MIDVYSAEKQDLDELCQIETDSFHGDRLSRRSMRYMISNPNAVIKIAKIGNRSAGYALMLERKNSRSYRIYSLAVSPNFRGHGIAGILLQSLEKTAKKPHIRLEVRKDNLAAQKLYSKFGYTEYKRQDAFYEDNQPAIFMSKHLPLDAISSVPL